MQEKNNESVYNALINKSSVMTNTMHNAIVNTPLGVRLRVLKVHAMNNPRI
jgi:hypothetical protein